MKTDERYTKVFPVSWEQLHRDGRALAWKLLGVRPWAGIVAITRGGLVPAAIIARELGIHVIETICLSSYDWQEQGQCSILKGLPPRGEDWILIDDLVDTGKTARVVRDMLPQAFFATIYAKPAGRPLVDLYVTEVSQDTWILFPWDSDHQFSQPIINRAQQSKTSYDPS